MIIRRTLAAWVFCALAAGEPPRLGAEDARTTLEVIAEGYLANRAAFTHGKCRYEYSHGTAATEEDARAGKWSDHWPRATREFVMHFRDERLSIQAISDDATLSRQMRAGAPVLSPMNILVNGDYAMDHDGLINTAILHSPKAWALKIRYQPFNLAEDGESNPGSALAAYLRGERPDLVVTVIEQAELAGRQGVVVDYSSPIGSHRVRKLFDSSLGYLPAITEWYRADTGKFDRRTFVEEVHRHHGAVFPLRAVSAAPTVDQHGVAYCEVREMKVLELDLDYIPTDADLTIQIPRNTQFQDGISSKGSKTLYRDSPEPLVRISANDVKPIFDQLQEVAAERARDESAAMSIRTPPASGRRGSILPWLLAANVGALAVIIGIYWQRRRRGQQAAG
jgi:hypothetical protein